MRNILLFSLLFLMAQMGVSQDFLKIGPKASISSSSVKPGDLIILNAQDARDLSLAFQESTSSLQFGGFLRLSVLGFYVQPEVMVGTSKIQYQWESVVLDDESVMREEKFINVDIPVMAGFKLAFLRLQGGPVYRMTFNSSSELVDVDGLGRKFRDSNIDFRLGAGVDLGPVLIDLYYQAPFRDNQDLLIIGGNSYALNTSRSQMVASLGFAF